MKKIGLHRSSLLRDLLPPGTPIPPELTEKPILIDLFCGAGCAAEGYITAGFTLFGIDIKAPSSYPGFFLQGDWLRGLSLLLPVASAIHASPPCQEYSRLKGLKRSIYADLLEPVREALQRTGLPYIIENVTSAPLHNQITLSGTQFGLECIKKRGFESNSLLMMPGQAKERGLGFPSLSGHNFSATHGRKVYGTKRQITRKELAEGIPPQYTAWLGWQLMAYCSESLS